MVEYGGKYIDTFKIYPDSVYGFFFLVEIYRNKKDMRTAANKISAQGFRFYSDARAITCTYRKVRNINDKKIFSKELGTILFSATDFNAELIAHECCHACVQWAEEKQLKVARNPRLHLTKSHTSGIVDEELFCTSLGLMVAQVIRLTKIPLGEIS